MRWDTFMKMDVQELTDKIDQAFSNVPYPGDEKVASCPCPECEDVRRDFCGQTPATIESEVIAHNFESLRLFSPEAYQFFLPAYLLYSINDLDSDVLVWVLFSLARPSKGHLRLFSNPQKEAVLEFVKWVQTIDEFNDYAPVEEARRVWQTVG
jgi:hypothetical protein